MLKSLSLLLEAIGQLDVPLQSQSFVIQSKMLSLPVFLPLLLQLLPAYCYYYEYRYWELNEPPPICSEYEMLIVNTHQCVRRCNIVCQRGVCFEDGPCPCADQYQSAHRNSLVCAAECVPGCQQAGGHCAGPELCICRKSKHYYYDAVARRCRRRGPRLLDLCGGYVNFLITKIILFEC